MRLHYLLRLLSFAFLWFILRSFLVKYLNFFTLGFFFCFSSTTRNFAYLVALFMLCLSTFSAFSNLTLFSWAKYSKLSLGSNVSNSTVVESSYISVIAPFFKIGFTLLSLLSLSPSSLSESNPCQDSSDSTCKSSVLSFFASSISASKFKLSLNVFNCSSITSLRSCRIFCLSSIFLSLSCSLINSCAFFCL
ncbi:hypothetical protein WN66_01498 [Saccharomyces cerevisiae]|nr:hypothetical protein WN66_01498 [Saccharomyces cerevisiae]